MLKNILNILKDLVALNHQIHDKCTVKCQIWFGKPSDSFSTTVSRERTKGLVR